MYNNQRIIFYLIRCLISFHCRHMRPSTPTPNHCWKVWIIKIITTRAPVVCSEFAIQRRGHQRQPVSVSMPTKTKQVRQISQLDFVRPVYLNCEINLHENKNNYDPATVSVLACNLLFCHTHNTRRSSKWLSRNLCNEIHFFCNSLLTPNVCVENENKKHLLWITCNWSNCSNSSRNRNEEDEHFEQDRNFVRPWNPLLTFIFHTR